jgi:Ran GTPase-activating protein (RanGAP) involved in mRNA processing and transport
MDDAQLILFNRSSRPSTVSAFLGNNPGMEREDLEQLIWNPPSPENWRLLCEAIHALPSDSSLAPLLARVEEAIQLWPYELRSTMCNLPWDEQLIKGIHNQKTSIVRYLRYDRIFSGRYGELMFRSPNATPENLLAMCASSVTKNLQKINLSYQKLGPSAGEMLASSASLARLESLEISSIELKHGLADLARAPWLTNLRELKINGNLCGDVATKTFLLSLNLAALEILGLSHNLLTASISPYFIEERLPGLRSLDLSENKVEGDGLALLSSSFPLEKLQHLNVSGNQITTLSALSSFPRELNLSSNLFSAAAVPHLFQSKGRLALSMLKCNLSEGHFYDIGTSDNIDSLDLSENALLGENCVASLARKLPALKRFFLRACALSGEGLLSFAKSLRDVEALDLSLNQLRKPFILALSQQELPLQELFLEKASLTDPSFAVLADAPWCKTLRKLSLRENKMSKGGYALFSVPMPEIEELWLDDLGIDEAGAIRLARSSWRPKVLHINNNPLGDTAVCALAESPVLQNVTRLNLNKTHISDIAAQALANSPYLKSLEVLHIEKNSIGDKGAQLLSACRHWRKIHWGDNPKIGNVGKKALNSWPRRCCP